MSHLIEKLGPAAVIMFLYCAPDLFRRLTVKSQTPILITDTVVVLIAGVFTEITAAGVVIWGVPDMTEYTWVIHHVAVAIASFASCGFLFFLWRDKRRFKMRYGMKRQISLIAAMSISLVYFLPIDLIASAFFPMDGFDPKDVSSRLLFFAIGNMSTSIGFGALLCFMDVIFISKMFALALEAKSRKTNAKDIAAITDFGNNYNAPGVTYELAGPTITYGAVNVNAAGSMPDDAKSGGKLPQ